MFQLGNLFFYEDLNMENNYYRRSSVTGRTYDLFQCVKILNTQQAIFYLQHGVPLMDLQVSNSHKNDKPILVFVFKKQDTAEAWELWNLKKGEIYRQGGATNGYSS